MHHITVLSGGVGGATFLTGLLHGVRRGLLAGIDLDAEVTVVANTADDIWLHGLKICPDLDTVMYTLGGGINEEQGWGRADETFHLKEELGAYGVGPEWFGLGDRDFATHIVRTQMIGAGYPLSAADVVFLDPLRNRRNDPGHCAAFGAQGECCWRFDDAGLVARPRRVAGGLAPSRTLVGRWSPRLIVTDVG